MDNVLFPRFWIEEPALWFAQVEAVFALNNITSDTDKYDYILCELPSTVISLIKDLILDTTFEEEKYETVKKELIKRISISELEKEEIGGKKPSEFYQHLKKKADFSVSDKFLREIWLKKLPLQVNFIVCDMKGDMQSICKLADTVIEHIPVPCLNKISEGAPKVLRCQLENIYKELQKFKTVYSENIVNLGNIQSEFNKVKYSYDENNIRLNNIQTELQKIKSVLCVDNDKSLCNNAKESKSAKSSEGDQSCTNSDSNQSQSTTEDDDRNVEKAMDTVTEVKSDAFRWFGIGTNNSGVSPSNFK